MKVSQVFAAKYLTTAMVKEGQAYVIREAKCIPFGMGRAKTIKPVVWFEGSDVGLPLSKVNAMAVAEHLGDDTDTWVGGTVVWKKTVGEVNGEAVEMLALVSAEPKPVKAKAK